MNCILLRIALPAWMLLCLARFATAQIVTHITIFENDKTLATNARVTVHRGLNNTVSATRLIATGTAVAGSVGVYSVGALPGEVDRLWVKIDRAPEMAPIEKQHGAWQANYDVTKADVVSAYFRPPVGLTLVFVRFKDCPLDDGNCRTALWGLVPTETVPTLEAMARQDSLRNERPCDNCARSDPGRWPTPPNYAPAPLTGSRLKHRAAYAPSLPKKPREPIPGPVAP